MNRIATAALTAAACVIIERLLDVAWNKARDWRLRHWLRSR